MTTRESARERAIRRAAEAATIDDGTLRKVREEFEPEPTRREALNAEQEAASFRLRKQAARRVRNAAAGRGDVIKVGKHRAVVLTVEWRDPTWAVTYSNLIEKATRLSNAEPAVTYLLPTAAPKRLGAWKGTLEPGSQGYVEDGVPSDTASTDTQTRSTNRPTGQKEDGIMPTVVKRSSKKSGAKGAAKSNGKAAAPKAEPKAETTSTRRTQADTDALVPKFLKAIQGGATLRAVKQEFGYSDDGPIRAALYRAGYTSKGEEHGEDAGSIDASKAAGKKRVVALRSEGAGWYRLAFLTGLTESEVKALVKDAGGSTKRVYTHSEKPAKAETKSEVEASAARKGAGKKVTRRASKADPSKKG